jgi:DNA-binding transcriptional ArsR family regulator
MKSGLKVDAQKAEFTARKMRSITHPVRMQVVKLLEEHERLSVTQIINYMNVPQAEMSGHLGILREYGILKKVRSGKMSIYSLNKETIESIIDVSEEMSKKF